MTRLAILANTRHHQKNGDLYVLSRVAAQLDQLGSLFDEAEACVPLYDGPLPSNFEPYLRGRTTLTPLRPAGGPSLRAKAQLVARALAWVPPLRHVARRADLVHLRCPCNVALIALLLLPRGVPWYGMYAGTWEGYEGEPWSYRLQRWLLIRRGDGIVTAYVAPGHPHPEHVVPFFSPTHTEAELAAETERTAAKLAALAGGIRPNPFRAVSVGHLTANKNHGTTIRALADARRAGLDVELDIAGDGGLRQELENLVDGLALSGVVRLHGILPREKVLDLYRAAHVNILLSYAEGFPKVIMEGMAAGAPALLSRFPLSASLTGEGERGLVLDGRDPSAVASALVDLAGDPQRLAAMGRAAQAYATRYSLESFRGQLERLFSERWPNLFTEAPRSG